MKMTIRLSFAFAVSLASTFGQGECLADGSPDTQYRYRYVSLSQAALPSGYASFIPAEVIDSGKVRRELIQYGKLHTEAPRRNLLERVFFKLASLTVLQEYWS